MTQASPLPWRRACSPRRAARRRAKAKPGMEGMPMLPGAGCHTALSGWTPLLPSEGPGTLPKRGTSTLLSASLRVTAPSRRRGTGAGGTGTPPGEQLPRAQRSMTRRAGRRLRRRRVRRALSRTARQGLRCQPCVPGFSAELSEATCWLCLREQAVLQEAAAAGERCMLALHTACMLAQWSPFPYHVKRGRQAQQGLTTEQCAAQSCAHSSCSPVPHMPHSSFGVTHVNMTLECVA